MNFTRNFNQISKSDTVIAGGKGASLGEMTKAGIPVPTGFVILSSAFEKFLESADLNVEIDSILHAVNHKKMHTVENASEKIKDLILKAKMPKSISEEIKKEFKNLKSKFVAIRSSATAEDSSSAAWAGQLDSFLNTTEKTLLANVQKCWASLFTPRAIFYRFEKGLHDNKISVAVVAQKMVESEVSGIAFSVHPVTQDRNQLIIEAGYGLGEAIVSGQITPDSYVVEKNPRRIIDKNVSVQERGVYRKPNGGGNEWQNIPEEKGRQQKLTNEQILELSELIIKIENHYGAPQDIEWAYEKNKFYITQSRPITTLGGTSKIEKVTQTDFLSLKPITDKDLEKYTFKPVGGRACYYWIHYCLIRNFTKSKDKWPLNLGVVGDSSDHIVKWSYLWPHNLDLVSYLHLYLNDQNRLTDIEKYITKQVEDVLEKINCVSLSEANTEELSILTTLIFEKFSNISYIAAVLRIIDISIQYYLNTFLPANAPKADIIRLAGIPHTQSYSIKEKLEMLYLALEICNNKISKQEKIKKLDNIRNRYCWYVCGYYNEKARTIDNYEAEIDEIVAGDPQVLIDEIKQRHVVELAERKKVLSWLNKEQKTVADMAAFSAYLKDYYKYMSNKIIYSIEPFFDEIAERTGQAAEFIKELNDIEISQLMKGNKPSESYLRERAKHNTMVAFDRHFNMYIGKDADYFLGKFLTPISSAKELKGIIASKGHVKGIARIVRSSNEFYKVQTGDILVVINTTPDYVPILKNVAGIVAEEGGITAHVSVVSREFNIPAIVGIPRVYDVLKDGDLVEVDADKGVVRILERAK